MQRKIALTLLVFLGLLGASFALAQESGPQIIISWKASNSYAPSFFQGKLLPTRSSPVNARVLVLENGQIRNLAQTEIRWYLNGKLIKSGQGLTETQISFDQLANRYNELSLTLRQYKGSDFSKSVALPIHPPKVLLNDGNLLNSLNKDSALLIAHPFFFSIEQAGSLFFNWKIGKESYTASGISGSQVGIDLSRLEPGEVLDIALEVENALNSLEKASYEKQFIVQ
ncbi:MAG: hypothetical protein Q8Q32_01185 [bacterium]|nr:hypothetical protein [bacterium]